MANIDVSKNGKAKFYENRKGIITQYDFYRELGTITSEGETFFFRFGSVKNKDIVILENHECYFDVFDRYPKRTDKYRTARNIFLNPRDERLQQY